MTIPEEVRAQRIGVRLLPHERALLDSAARAREITLSEVVRRAIAHEAKQVLEEQACDAREDVTHGH
jgi:uncharacterized protein (DUF1778 family)